MTEHEKDTGNEKFIILPLGEESKKITQVISNDTARQIIELLSDKPLSASDVAQHLHAPLTTIAYNLENLESVGLVRIEKIKYSEKGREVKIYAPVRKLIIVVPEKTDRKSVADMLRSYLGVILAAVFASALVEFLAKSAGRNAKTMRIGDSIDSISVPHQPVLPMPAITSTPAAMNETAPAQTSVYGVNAATTPAPVPASIPESGIAGGAAPDIFTGMADMINAHPGAVFLLGCMFVIALFVIMEYRRKR